MSCFNIYEMQIARSSAIIYTGRILFRDFWRALIFTSHTYKASHHSPCMHWHVPHDSLDTPILYLQRNGHSYDASFTWHSYPLSTAYQTLTRHSHPLSAVYWTLTWHSHLLSAAYQTLTWHSHPLSAAYQTRSVVVFLAQGTGYWTLQMSGGTLLTTSPCWCNRWDGGTWQVKLD